MADELEHLAHETHNTYLQTTLLTDLELSVQKYEQLLSLTPHDDPNRPYRSYNLAICYRDRYGRLGAAGDLEAAIQCGEQAVNLILESDDYTYLADPLNNLVADYGTRFKRYGHVMDLASAIICGQQAVEFSPDALRLHNLGIHYRIRYKRFGALSDLEAAIQNSQQAIDLTQDDDQSNRAALLGGLAVCYNDRYERSGTLSDLEAAIRGFQEVLDLTPRDHPDRAERLNNLAIGYNFRYRRNAALGDLELSNQQLQEALDLVPQDHPYRPTLLRGLGRGYSDRYRSIRAPNDLELSIKNFQEALDLTPDNHADRSLLHHDLGVGYVHRYLSTVALSDLELCIENFQTALFLTPKEQLNRAELLASMGSAYHLRYQYHRLLADLELSAQVCEESLNFISENHPYRAVRLIRLGRIYLDQYRETGERANLELSMRQFQEGLKSGSSISLHRLESGQALFEIYAEAGNWSSAYDTACRTVSLIPLITSRSLERSDVQRLVDGIVGLASDAAATTLIAGKSVYEAMQLLEVGRGIIASSLGDMRTDITELSQKFPDLAVQFDSLRYLLDSPKGSRSDDTQRYNTGKQIEELIEKIRSLPGFDRFLLGPREDELKEAAACGPIVVINISKYGCHALIIEQEGLRALELPYLNIEDIRTKAIELASPNTEVLEWLWDEIAKPVLASLNFVQTPDHNTWPRIWWILTGLLAQFPIHAAGRYSDGEILDSVMDRVISSYSSSLKALINAHGSSSISADEHGAGSMVVVGMEETPGHGLLQFASEEVEALAGVGNLMQLQVKQPLPCREEVLLALNGCKIFHFAGHGHVNLSDPSQSALVLGDGRLTVESIFDMNLQHKPFLAYLSACGTGQVKHDGFVDEGLHLIGACQLAGFRHVIGTLWQVNDESCVGVAKETYQWIQMHGLRDRSVGEGLHHACRNLRSQWTNRKASGRGIKSGQEASVQQQPLSAAIETRYSRDIVSVRDPPLHWVPYVHFGI